MDKFSLKLMVYILYLLKFILVINFSALAIIDWKKFKLPDSLQISALILITIIFYISEIEWINHIVGLLAALVAGLIIYYISFLIYKKQVFGFGDVKLLSVIGYLCGIEYFLYVFIGGTLLATVFALTGIMIGKYTWQSKIPLGTFLCVVAIIFILFKEQ